MTVQACALVTDIDEGGRGGHGQVFPYVAIYASFASDFICIIRITLINLL